MIKLTDLNGVTTSVRDRHRRFSTTVRHSILVRDKNIDENAKAHMKHKPYECDIDIK